MNKFLLYSGCLALLFVTVPAAPAVPDNHHEGPDESWRKGALDPTTFYLVNNTECRDDVKRICPHLFDKKKEANEQKVMHNFEILDCFLSSTEHSPSDKCQHQIWLYKKTLTLDPRFESAAKQVCSDFIMKHNLTTYFSDLPAERGIYLSHLMEFANNFQVRDEATDNSPCYQFLDKMEAVIFSDYHLIYKFAEDCDSDISKYECGRLLTNDNDEDITSHNQGLVIDCLMNQTRGLTPECKLQVLRVAELQSDDYHLDRQLFFACGLARDTLCPHVEAGGGKVYQCLIEKKSDAGMPEACRNQLVKREQLMQEDVKVNKGLFSSCHEAFEKHGCLKAGEKGSHHVVSAMSHVFVCMLHKENEIGELDLTQECQDEVTRFQREIMSDFKITPIIAVSCVHEIESCGGFHKAMKPGEMLHCLMGKARPSNDYKNEMTDECKAALGEVVEEANPSADLSIDKYLMALCDSQIEEHCKNNEEKLDCLMEQIENGNLEQNDPCAGHLLELEYFITRNYQLDRQLMKKCLPSLKAYGLVKTGPEKPGADSMVFSSLWKHVHDQVFKQLEPHNNLQKIPGPCIEEVLRIVHERTVNIDLKPDIEGPCLKMLSQYCSSSEPGRELECLEDHYDDIQSNPDAAECLNALKDQIKDEDEDLKLDYVLMKSCSPAVKAYCKEVVDAIKEGEIDEGELIECLIDHKFEEHMTEKCFAGITHHQIIHAKDFEFTAKFKQACRGDFDHQCKKAKTKMEAIVCLSEIVRNDTLSDATHRVSLQCRKQLQFELLAQEDAEIDIDPEMKEACAKDIKLVCTDADKTTDGYMHCLRMNQDKISSLCMKYIMKTAQLEKVIAGANARIFRTCKRDIKNHCSKVAANDPMELVQCLDHVYDDLSSECQAALNQEEEEENTDIRLNPALMHTCGDDIEKFCSEVLDEIEEGDKAADGKVINCLKTFYLKKKSPLTEKCHGQMHLLIVRVQTRDYKQDIRLTNACDRHIKQCMSTISHKKKDTMQVEILDCLKKKMIEGKLSETKDAQCLQEVFRLITENRVDIDTDSELYHTCQTVIESSICGKIPSGDGRRMACLLDLHEKRDIKDKDCDQLVAERKDLWSKAAKFEPAKDFAELFSDINSSSSRWYFMSVISCVLLVILVVGVVCGRMSKRVAAEIKNK